MAVLALLIAGTGWAVASWLSVWLVVPYLILMALLLLPSAGRPPGDSIGADSDGSRALRPARPGEDLDNRSSDGPASAEPPEDGAEQANASGPARARRGKGRARKAKLPPEPSEATWVQVAPGKFVRVEAPETPGQDGPHAPVGLPVEVPATPHSLETDEVDALDRADGPGSDEAPQGAESSPGPEARIEGPGLVEGTADGQEDDPIGGVESGSPTALEGVESAGSPGIFEGPSVADGNTPQAEGPLEDPRSGWPDAAFEAVQDRAEAGPGGGGSEEEGEQSPSSQDPESTDRLALADVPAEDVDERGATFAGADPTEIPVDETDLDDAGPFGDDPRDLDASPDADSSELVADPGPSTVSTWWPRRLAPGARTRVGHPPRAIDRRASPRRPVRSPGPSRRPTDPRRLARRGLGRPRQITRTFPPRSPPGCRVGRGGWRLWFDCGGGFVPAPNSIKAPKKPGFVALVFQMI
jgi:hypothetical protein